MLSGINELLLNGPITQMQFWTAATVTQSYPWWIWKLIPVKLEDASASSRSSSVTLDPDHPPPFDGNATGQSATHVQHAESEHDDLGTVVTEVTTTVITTRKDVESKTHNDFRFFCPCMVFSCLCLILVSLQSTNWIPK